MAALTKAKKTIARRTMIPSALSPTSSFLFEFEQIGATYWFDFASSAALPQEDPTIAAWAITPINVHRRDVS